MPDSIISRIHLLLMETVDGPAAERFGIHIAKVVGDINTVNQRYTESEQLTWLSAYWIQQISASCISDDQFGEYNLLACHTPDEFIQVFMAIIMPCLRQHPSLPDISLPVISLYHQTATPHMVNNHG